jgi:D-alanyl-lipoteichoic acid acyltransferase DltB (MBOAT superfamily)
VRKVRLIFNLFVVWFLTGLWHGAALHFIAWGLVFFVLLSFEKFFLIPKRFSNTGAALYRIFTLLCVLFSWVLFRAESLKSAVKYMLSMFALRGNPLLSDQAISALREYKVFLIAGIILSTPIIKHICEYFKNGNRFMRCSYHITTVASCCFLFFWSLSFLILGSHNPFLYFNF